MVAVRVTRAEEVREALLAELLDGRSPVGTKLPNESALATRFEVSRATVREATRILIDGGYLVRRHGSGTYVTSLPRRQHSLEVTLSYTQMIRDAGMTPGLKLLTMGVRQPTDEEASRLELTDGEAVLELCRIRTADNRPIVYSVDVIPERVIRGLDDAAFGVSLFDVLSDAGSRVRTATAVLLPVNATPEIAAILDVQRGVALQHIDELDFTSEGTPVLLSSEWHVPGVFELRVNRRS